MASSSMAVFQSLKSVALTEGMPALCQPILQHTPWVDFLLLAVVTAPHVLYAIIWLRPQCWQSLFGAQAVGVFAFVAISWKLVTFQVRGSHRAAHSEGYAGLRRAGADADEQHHRVMPTRAHVQVMIIWVWATRPAGLCLDLTVIQLWQFMAALLLAAFGQSLNLAVYQTIGVDGVYYGGKLGATVEWVQGWPFNLSPHPQYLGSALTVWGCTAIMYNQYADGSTHQISMVLVSIYLTILWALTAAIETFL